MPLSGYGPEVPRVPIAPNRGGSETGIYSVLILLTGIYFIIYYLYFYFHKRVFASLHSEFKCSIKKGKVERRNKAHIDIEK